MATVSKFVESGQRRSADAIRSGLVVLVLRPAAAMPWYWICVEELSGARIPIHVDNLGEVMSHEDQERKRTGWRDT
jgi:hypothetical protein